MKKLVKIIGVLALAALLVFVLDIGCMFRSLTGFPCLGCGTTRACLAFLQGHVVDAFYYHPLFWLSTIFLMYLTVYIVRMVLLFPDVPPMDYNYGAPLYRVYQWLASLFAN